MLTSAAHILKFEPYRASQVMLVETNLPANAGTIQGKLAWPLGKNDRQIRESMHILKEKVKKSEIKNLSK